MALTVAVNPFYAMASGDSHEIHINDIKKSELYTKKKKSMQGFAESH